MSLVQRYNTTVGADSACDLQTLMSRAASLGVSPDQLKAAQTQGGNCGEPPPVVLGCAVYSDPSLSTPITRGEKGFTIPKGSTAYFVAVPDVAFQGFDLLVTEGAAYDASSIVIDSVKSNGKRDENLVGNQAVCAAIYSINAFRRGGLQMVPTKVGAGGIVLTVTNTDPANGAVIDIAIVGTCFGCNA